MQVGDLNRDLINVYGRPRREWYNMFEYYDGGLDEEARLLIQQRKTWAVWRDDKREKTLEQD